MKIRFAVLVLSLVSLLACSRGTAPKQSIRSPAPAATNNCPQQPPLDPGPDAVAAASAAAQAAVPTLYPPIGTNIAGFQVTNAALADPNAVGYGAIPFGMCGSEIGQRTVVVELHFPAMDSQGADIAHGQLFLSRFADGWKVWFQYH